MTERRAIEPSSTIELRSDNAAGAAREVLAAIAAANTGSALGYGADPWTAELQQIVRQVFEHESAQVFPVVSGTAANALALSAMCPPWGAVLCHEAAHIVTNEGAATSLLGGGLALRGLPGADHRLPVATLEEALDTTGWGDNHVSQPAVVSITQASEHGTVYRPVEVAALASVAAAHGLRMHVDGARFANAVAALGCSPAELTWQAGVSALSLGAIKNGGLSADAIVSFDDDVSAELHYRTKRAGHVLSKMRFQSAQLVAYLNDDLWLRNARQANATMARLAAGLTRLGVELLNRVDTNIAFARVPDDVAVRLEAAGLLFYRMGPGTMRLVTSFQTTDTEVDDALTRVAACLS